VVKSANGTELLGYWKQRQITGDSVHRMVRG